MLPDVGVTQGVRSLRDEGLLLDYTIEVEDKEFKVHKVILASVSDYFKVMLTGGMAESQTDRVRLEGLSSLAVSNLIEFIYTAQFGSVKAKAEELLACAVYLQIPAAIEVCAGLLYDELDVKNCFNVLATLQNYTIKNEIAKTVQYMKSNFDGVFEACTPAELDHKGFQTLMDIWEKSEWDLFLTLKEWLYVDYEHRKQHTKDLMSHLRFALLTPEQLETIKEMDLYSGADDACHELIKKAEDYHNLLIHQKVLDDSVQSCVRNKPSPICYVGCGDSSTYYSLHKKSWKQAKAALDPHLLNDICEPIIVNNFLIVYDDIRNKWHIFDPRTLKWSPMASMEVPRTNFALAHHGKHLYALGGFRGLRQVAILPANWIERYDFETNTWHEIDEYVPFPVQGGCAGVVDGSIYIGTAWPDNFTSRSLHCLNLATTTWSSKPSMPLTPDNPFDLIHLMELRGLKVLVVFCSDCVLQYFAPSTSQWSVLNCSPYISTKLDWSKYCTVLPGRNELVFLNFDSGDGKKSRMCSKWAFEEGGLRPTELKLDDFPVGKEDFRSVVCVSLAIPPEL